MKTVLLLAALIWTGAVVGQTEPDFSLYRQVGGFYNPALVKMDTFSCYVDMRFSLQNGGAYIKQPQAYVSCAGKFKRLRGVFGLTYFYDSYSFYNQNWIGISYTQSIEVNKHQELILAGRVSFVATYLQLDKVQAISANPGYSSERINNINPDIDIGFAYKIYDGVIGVGVKHLLSPTVNAIGMTFVTNPSAFYFLGAYDVPIKHLIISPSVFIKKETTWSYQGTLAFDYKKFFSIGATLVYPTMRYKVFVGTRAIKGLSVFLAFDGGFIDQIMNGEPYVSYSFE